MIRTVGYWLGALYELVTGWPWRDLGAAGVLLLTITSVYAFLWMAAAGDWPR